MAYALIATRHIYDSIFYTIYNIKTKKVEYCNESQLIDYLKIDYFINLEYKDGKISGVYCNLNDYLLNQKKIVYTCIKSKDNKYSFVDSLGNLYNSKELIDFDYCMNKFFLNVSPGKYKSSLGSVKQREKTKLLVKTVYISFLQDTDGVIMLVNSLYDTNLASEFKIKRLRKVYKCSSDEDIKIDGLCDNNIILYLLYGVERKIEIKSLELRDMILNQVKDTYMELESYSEDNSGVYVSSLDLSENVLEKLRLLQ